MREHWEQPPKNPLSWRNSERPREICIPGHACVERFVDLRGFQVEGGGGRLGVRTKNSLRDAVIGQNNDFIKGSGKQTIQPLDVAEANTPKKWGMWHFRICGPTWL